MTGRDKLGRFIEGHPSLLTEESIKKISKNNARYWFGKKRSLATRRKISKKLATYVGEYAFNWKGDRVGYRGLHKWITKWFGRPNHCELCKTKVRRKYHWANKYNEYSRVREDWLRVCVPCHKRYDLERLKKL